MGIKGFWKYEDRQCLSVSNRLHDTKLLIDGNSLSKHLFENAISQDCNFKSKYFSGGDYADFSVYVRTFFGQLAHCNVQPVVIFDGCSKFGIEPSVRLARLRHQHESRLKKAIELCAAADDQSEVKVQRGQTHWVSISTVLFQVLRDLDIVHRQCVTREADEIIPVIARYYRCPVWTMDSDFLLWDLPGGVISMSEPFKTNSHNSYIECSIYYRESGLLAHLESKYGFKREMFPLVGPLLGYDQVYAQIATRFAGHANQDQLSKLKLSFKTQIRSVLQQFASHFTSFRNKVIANYFVQSTLEKLNTSFERFSSTSERELNKVEQSLVAKLDEITKSSIDLELNKLNEIKRQFGRDLAQFEETVKQPSDSPSFNPWLSDRFLCVFRWLSSQQSLNEAKEKLAQFCVELKMKNYEFIMKNIRFGHNSWYKRKKTFEDGDFDSFLCHLMQIPISYLYEELENKICSIKADLPIEQFLDKMNDDFFPQSPRLPLVFHGGLVKGIINPRLLNILYTKLVLYSTQIENYEILSCSYAGTFDLDAYIYGIILSNKDDETQEVTRIYREGTNQMQVQVQPKFVINGKRLPNLEQISNMTEADRRDLLFTIIKKVCFTCEVNIDALIDKMQLALPSQCQSVVNAFLLMTLSLIMCTHKCPLELTHSPKWNSFLRAMFINIFLKGYIGPTDSYVPTFLTLDQEQIGLFRTKFIDPIPPPTVDLTISHYFNFYHNCLQSLNFLTQLLNLYECFELDRFVCGLQGSFVHALTQHFEHNDQCFESLLKSMNFPGEINELLIEIQKIVI